jgi:hypothetical protein
MGSKLCGRRQVNPRLDLATAMDPGAFLGRLWALPSYGGDHEQLEKLRPVLEDFERLLDATEPVDCEHVFRAGVEHGGGESAVGWRDGKSFERSASRPHR